ncbi:WG repeat-containing protein [Pedobacter sp. KR3-3]|uniref:WG repeat-containing protein n=1 Tax=Pedobacter albus TaxID=3113905 RepID=A0ABU7I3Z9_9SPHI|nr:WG repeat-containing protein [Pedobacter sp. KR3-3]MEE1944191.1 WG repeat-containing protein [Pedobacter sp. KR3-3]
MKRFTLLFFFLLIGSVAFAQNGYQKKYAYNQYNKDWALVKTVSGTYGFIDRDGKVVVPAIYAKIEKFGKYNENLAMVKSISDTYGFIDRNGKVVIPATYKLKDIEQNFQAIYKNHSQANSK